MLTPTDGPDWSTRPWGRPIITAASSDIIPSLRATVEFKYHGMRIRGVRLYQEKNRGMTVSMPQKRFGDSIESVVYFTDAVEREQFVCDVVWLYRHVFGEKKVAG